MGKRMLKLVGESIVERKPRTLWSRLMTEKKQDQPERKAYTLNLEFIPFEEDDFKSLRRVIQEIAPAIEEERKRSTSFLTKLDKAIMR